MDVMPVGEKMPIIFAASAGVDCKVTRIKLF